MSASSEQRGITTDKLAFPCPRMRRVQRVRGLPLPLDAKNDKNLSIRG